MAGSVNARMAAAGARKLMTRAPFHAGARSCEQSKAAQRDLHHLVDGFYGRQACEAQATAMRGALDLVGALGQRAQVRALGERRGREFTLEPGLGVLEPRVPRPVGGDLLGCEQLEDRPLLLGALQRRERRIDRRLAEAVRDE